MADRLRCFGQRLRGEAARRRALSSSGTTDGMPMIGPNRAKGPKAATRRSLGSYAVEVDEGVALGLELMVAIDDTLGGSRGPGCESDRCHIEGPAGVGRGRPSPLSAQVGSVIARRGRASPDPGGTRLRCGFRAIAGCGPRPGPADSRSSRWGSHSPAPDPSRGFPALRRRPQPRHRCASRRRGTRQDRCRAV